MYPNKLYINGEWTTTEDTIDVVNPATKEVIGHIPKGGEKEAAAAADAAATAFKTWSKKTAQERSTILMKWHQLIEQHQDELAEIMTTEQGKPVEEAKANSIRK